MDSQNLDLAPVKSESQLQVHELAIAPGISPNDKRV
jgi:hypothetical protein